MLAEALRSLGSEPDDVMQVNAGHLERKAVLDALAKQARLPADDFVLVLIGHGSVSADGFRFNIRGPDLTTEDLVAGLNAVAAPRQSVIVATSASGALLDVLSQPGRQVVTATKSGGELNAVRFPEFLAAALEDGAADVDRNEILTLAEVFRFANQKTADYYEDKKLLASEHPRLTGDAPASVALARRGALRAASSDPAVAGLLDSRLSLEQEFHALKKRKPDLTVADYYDKLETLLLSIARVQRDIDKATGWQQEDSDV